MIGVGDESGVGNATITRARANPAASIPSLLTLLTQRASGSAALVALDEDSVSYATLADSVAGLASQLAAVGIREGSTIVTVLRTGPLSAALTLSSLAAGICCPVRTTATAPELRQLVLRLHPSAFLIEQAVSGAARTFAAESGITILNVAASSGDVSSARITVQGTPPRERGPDSTSGGSLILQTSGTTGTGKLVPLSWPTMYAAAGATTDAYGLTERDRRLNLSLLSHIQGAVGSLLAAVVSGGSIVLPLKFELEKVPEVINEHAVTWFSAGPGQHRQILATARAARFRSLRFVRVGSAALSRSLREQLEDFYQVPIVESYGMTEAHQIASTPLPPSLPRRGLVPTGSEVAIRTEDGCLTRNPGQRGELVVRGPNVAAGYMSPADGEISQYVNGWFHTGDQGEFLPDRSFRITSRLTDLINRNGSMISPTEVEGALLTHPDVADAGAFGLPHPILGEQLAVAVVLNDNASVSLTEILDFLRTLLSPQKLPDQVIFRDSLPLTSNGKLSRAGLARQATLSTE